MSVGQRWLAGSAVVLGTLLLAGCAQDPRCGTLEEAFARQTERVRVLSEYVAAGDPKADTVEALLLDLGLAMTVVDELAVLEDADVRCPDRVWCHAFPTGVEATVEMWRTWARLAMSSNGGYITVSDEGPAFPVRKTARKLVELTERARPRAEAADCACLPWSEAVAAWAAGGDHGPPDFDLELFLLANSRAQEAVDTCWPDRR